MTEMQVGNLKVTLKENETALYVSLDSLIETLQADIITAYQSGPVRKYLIKTINTLIMLRDMEV